MSYQVTVEPTGDVIEVEEGQTILDAALRQGCGCRLLAVMARVVLVKCR